MREGTESFIGEAQPSWQVEVEHLIGEAHEKKEYRPVAVAIVFDKEGKLLFVQSKKGPTDWCFPQGGVEANEDVVAALKRELGEETGMKGAELKVKGFQGVKELDAEPGRADKRGFTKGKKYFFFVVEYAGPQDLTLQAEEVTGYRWVEPGSAAQTIATTREEKRNLMQQVLTEMGQGTGEK